MIAAAAGQDHLVMDERLAHVQAMPAQQLLDGIERWKRWAASGR
jgi:hypothetical protein